MRKQFNPIETSRKIAQRYKSYIKDTMRFDDPELNDQLAEILEGKSFVSKGPFLEATPPYTKGKTPRELADEGLLCRSLLEIDEIKPDRTLYAHQEAAIRMANAGKNYAVVTGTGSGKTECFLIPIIDDILREFDVDGPSAGVRAMILYPMNALANDQLKRLRKMLKGTDITFGRYIGNTEWTEARGQRQWDIENPDSKEGKLPNELVSRETMRKTPPNILLTNYSMLEYLLLRPEDAPLFSGAFGGTWRHIAIDEAHMYSGTLGTEIAYLLRRLKARIAFDSGKTPKLRCYATSATIGTDQADGAAKVAKFAEDLFGEPFDHDPSGEIAVITSTQDSPLAGVGETWGPMPLGAWPRLANAIGPDGAFDGEAAAAVISEYREEPPTAISEAESPEKAVGSILISEKNAVKVIGRISSGLVDLTDADEISTIGVDGLSPDGEGCSTLSAMVEVLSAAKLPSGAPLLASRYHSFLRAPEGLYINLLHKRLVEVKITSQREADGCMTPVYEVAVCRRCGQTHVLGNIENDDECAWLNPRHDGTDADDDFRPRTYFRVILDNPEEEIEAEEKAAWLCPACGSLHDAKGGGDHRFAHAECERIQVAMASGEADGNLKCHRCGYGSSIAIQPLKVSPETAGSLVCYDLARDVPAFERESGGDTAGDRRPIRRRTTATSSRPGNIICFSDRRQEAAFFAPAMDRIYGRFTKRQMIREAVAELGKCRASDISRWIAETGIKRHPVYEFEGASTEIARRDRSDAWVLDEMVSTDKRNGLEGLGALMVKPEPIESLMDDDEIVAYIEDEALPGLPKWVGTADYKALLLMCVETIRDRNGIAWPEGALNHKEAKGREQLVVKGNTVNKSSEEIAFVGLPTGPENSRSRFVRKYAEAVHGCKVNREQACLILENIFDTLRELLEVASDDEQITDSENRYAVKCGDGFYLNRNLWTFRIPGANDSFFRCEKCGALSHFDTNGVCRTAKCDGAMVETTAQEIAGYRSHHSSLYHDAPLPLRVEEHTAQLSSDEARDVQRDFIKGDVHVLSCTTTFELGVDVGDLRAVFMRNVPPTTANYAQRAGRTGRREGMPGFAVTYAKLTPHDIEHYRDPEKIIKGETLAPACYLENETIAIRHVFAIALSQFFRDTYVEGEIDYSKKFSDFLSISRDNPPMLGELRDYFEKHAEEVGGQIACVLGDSPVSDSPLIGISEGRWIDELAAEGTGRLAVAHALLRDSYAKLDKAIREAASLDKPTGALSQHRDNLVSRKTIAVLAEGGVLPKYGFPTDVVELHLREQEQSKRQQLQLSRGLRQAIREYAPGAEVVAGKRLWRSTGVRRPNKKLGKLPSYYFGVCPTCESFVWSIEDDTREFECPSCKTTVKCHERMLIPLYGFEGRLVENRRLGDTRPKTAGYVKVHFSQSWKGSTAENVTLPGGIVSCRYERNGRLCATNKGPEGRGFDGCKTCNAMTPRGGDLEHESWCKCKEAPIPYHALAADFQTDVLEMTFKPYTEPSGLGMEAWRSLMWAIATSAASLLQIPEGEISATTYWNYSEQRMSILLYDDVPGGAGRVVRLQKLLPELLETALRRVSDCSCGEDSCCYGCLCSYLNQREQPSLSRGKAKVLLEAILTPSPDGAACDGQCRDFPGDPRERASSGLTADFSSVLIDDDFASVCGLAAIGSSKEWISLMNGLRELSSGLNLEVPGKDVEFSLAGDGAGEPAMAALAWRKAKVALLDEGGIEQFDEDFGSTWKSDPTWKVFAVGSCTAAEIVAAVKEA